MKLWRFVTVVALVSGLWVSAAQGAPPDPPPADPELRQALERYFERRLRTELGLTDAQVEEVLPRVRDLERERARSSRERRELSHQLRRAYREGAPDEELERLLGNLDAVETEHRARVRQLMSSIDRPLTVRQRVELRSFMERFRREIRQRVQRLRRGPGGRNAPDRRRPGADRPLPDRP